MGCALEQPEAERQQSQRSKFTRQREHRVDVAGGQQLAFVLLEPADASVPLASRTMAVAARVIGDGSVSTPGARIAMATERSSAATHDRRQYLLMLPVDPSAAAFEQALPTVANDVGHLQRRSAYMLRIASPGVTS
jgi:hypothetical protein